MNILHKITGEIIKTISAADLRGADLGDADLGAANLRGADLHGANLHGGNLRVANGIIDGGIDSRGYRFIGVRHARSVMIAAGCRWFNSTYARTHWNHRHDNLPAVKAECLARLDLIETIAKANGWEV